MKITMEILRFVAIECKLQMSGELSVYNMMRAYEYAVDDMPGRITQDDVLLLGYRVEPHDNALNHFRKVDVRVGWDVKAAWEEVPRLMTQLLEAQADLTPAEFFKEYEEIHPFRDGNGRTGAILFNKLNGSLDSPVWPPNFWNDPRRTVGYGA
jgi:hypothetical protein